MINLKNNYKLISIHEHEIEISYLEKKLSKHRENDCMIYQFLKKKEELKVSNEIDLLIKCRQSNCDIEFNKYTIVLCQSTRLCAKRIQGTLQRST